MRNDQYSGFTVGMFLGAAVGAGVALLYAPRSGAETRDQMRRLGERTMNGVGEFGETIRTRSMNAIDRVKDTAASVAERGRRAVDHAADEVETVADNLKSDGSSQFPSRTY